MNFDANFGCFSEEVVAPFRVHIWDDIPAVMKVYNLCFHCRSSHFTCEKGDQVEIGQGELRAVSLGINIIMKTIS